MGARRMSGDGFDRLQRPARGSPEEGGYDMSLDATHVRDNTARARRVPRYQDDTSPWSDSTRAPSGSTSSGIARHPSGVRSITAGTAARRGRTSTGGPAPDTTAAWPAA